MASVAGVTDNGSAADTKREEVCDTDPHVEILALFKDLKLSAPVTEDHARLYGGSFAGMAVIKKDGTPVTIAEMKERYDEAKTIHNKYRYGLVNCVWNLVRDTGLPRACPGCGEVIPWSEKGDTVVQHTWCYSCNGKGRKVTKQFKKQKKLFKKHVEKNKKAYASNIHSHVEAISALSAHEAIIDGVDQLNMIWWNMNYRRSWAHYYTTMFATVDDKHKTAALAYADVLAHGDAATMSAAFPSFMLELVAAKE
jgi:hypothetical protein